MSCNSRHFSPFHPQSHSTNPSTVWKKQERRQNQKCYHTCFSSTLSGFISLSRKWNLSGPSSSSSTTQNIKSLHNTNVNYLLCHIPLSTHPPIHPCYKYSLSIYHVPGPNVEIQAWIIYIILALQELPVTQKMYASVSPMCLLNTVNFLSLLHQGRKAGVLTLLRQYF